MGGGWNGDGRSEDGTGMGGEWEENGMGMGGVRMGQDQRSEDGAEIGGVRMEWEQVGCKITWKCLLMFTG